MRPGARLAAAIEVLSIFERNPAPIEKLLKQWARRSRYAGARDRAAVAERVFSVFRRRSECVAAMQGRDDARALVIGCLRVVDGLDAEAISGLFDGQGHAPAALSEAERALVETPPPDASRELKRNCPDWLIPKLAADLGEALDSELEALNRRAPLDLRVNTLRRTRALLESELAREHVAAAPIPFCIRGLRIADPGPDRKPINVKALKAFQAGYVEVQDAGSQVMSLLAGAQPGEQVVDLCAGGGGKTLALAAEMKNTGQLFACDLDRRRLAAVRPRLERAHVRNAQVRQLDRWSPGDRDVALSDLQGKVDLVFVDAPCSGSGAWRRHPDAKWRLTPKLLDAYKQAQADILLRAAPLLNAEGRLIYVTCSLLAEENDTQIAAFLDEHPSFGVEAPDRALADGGVAENGLRWRQTRYGVLLSPALTGCDGFYFAKLRRRR